VYAISSEEHGNTEYAARSSLTVQAMAHGDLSGIPDAFNFQLSAMAAGEIKIHAVSLQRGTKARRRIPR
jgi:hypothetical protein